MNSAENHEMGTDDDCSRSAIGDGVGGGKQNIEGETNKETTAVPQTWFDVVLAPGPLGIVVRADTAGRRGVRVQSISENSQCKGKIEVGDWIV